MTANKNAWTQFYEKYGNKIKMIMQEFDEEFYVRKYHDVKESGINPFAHFIMHGAIEGRLPNENYSNHHNDNCIYAVDAFVEYALLRHDNQVSDCDYLSDADKSVIEAIRNEFDVEFYFEQLGHRNIADPVAHYVIEGEANLIDPHHEFSVEFYKINNKDVADSGINLFFHYTQWGKNEKRKSSKSLKKGIKVGDSIISSEDVKKIIEQNLLDVEWYLNTYEDVRNGNWDVVWHYFNCGERNGYMPNQYFNPEFYVEFNGIKEFGVNCLLHYIKIGEEDGYLPSIYFDPVWYKNNYSIGSNGTALGHYIKNRLSNRFSPNKYFDVNYYLENNKDVAESGVDAFYHWSSWGIFEGRLGSTEFSQNFVWRKYLSGDLKKNPLEYFIRYGKKLGWTATPSDTETTVHDEIKKYTSPGSLFEDLNLEEIVVSDSTPKILAYYLPQFHAIPENDKWWGTGFTEWRNIPRGIPRFVGHYQPRLPRDLGYYDLKNDQIIFEQVALAKKAGIYGFCFYYYNFNGHRLLEDPLNRFCSNSEINFPFCLMWANENWTRRWDGYENDVLMRQDYKDENLPDLVDDLAKYLTHKNYFKINGRPILFIYRGDVIPDTKEKITEIKNEFIKKYHIDPIISVAQTFGVVDPRERGFDGAIEFPPHKIGSVQSEAGLKVKLLDDNFSGKIISYDEAIKCSLNDRPHEFNLIKTAFPSWDNDARKQGSGMCFIDGSPQKFEEWLDGLIGYAKVNKFYGESIICINAWNEWCEGAYLEPDCHYGYAYLNAVNRVINKSNPQRLKKKILLVGHDAFKAGAQQLLLNIGRQLKYQFGLDVNFVLLGGGDLCDEYNLVGDSLFVVDQTNDGWNKFDSHLKNLINGGLDCCITNTVVSGVVVDFIKSRNIRIVSLIHELPAIIRDYKIQDRWKKIVDNSDVIVFPNNYVKCEIENEFGGNKEKTLIKAQGIYKNIPSFDGAYLILREKLNIPSEAKIVVNVGYGDIRKGIDLFLLTAQLLKSKNIHFVWVGNLSPQIDLWIKRDAHHGDTKNVHFVNFNSEIELYLRGADVFYLTSREDPFPSVVLEALSVGLPCLAFDWGGGYVDLIKSDEDLGRLVEYQNLNQAASAIEEIVFNEENYNKNKIEKRINLMKNKYNFKNYCSDLISIAWPEWKKISVIVPNFNYAHHLEERLESIFNQEYPIHEIIILDDASSDTSEEVIARVLEKHKKNAIIKINQINTGNVFRQWKNGLNLASGDYIWIAEADDSAKPGLLKELVQVIDGCSFAFCDSVAIDSDGKVLYKNYKDYYASLGDSGLTKTNKFSADNFYKRFLAVRNLILNASSVLWDKYKLKEAFDILDENAFSLKCAGDWLLYVTACQNGEKVGFVATELNMHRRHSTSVTHSQNKIEHLDEINYIHRINLNYFNNDDDLTKKINLYIEDLKTYFCAN